MKHRVWDGHFDAGSKCPDRQLLGGFSVVCLSGPEEYHAKGTHLLVQLPVKSPQRKRGEISSTTTNAVATGRAPSQRTPEVHKDRANKKGRSRKKQADDRNGVGHKPRRNRFNAHKRGSRGESLDPQRACSSWCLVSLQNFCVCVHVRPRSHEHVQRVLHLYRPP